MIKLKSVLLVRRRETLTEDAFVEINIWRLGEPLSPSAHCYKYRLAYVVKDRCVLRYDNERGKGDHRHTEATERPYSFSTVGKLIEDFESDVSRWNHVHGRL